MLLSFFDEYMPRIHELMEREYVSGATINFPVKGPCDGLAQLHFTGHGILLSMGDRFSSKFITTWDVPPVIYNIYTEDLVGPVEFIHSETAEGFMKEHAIMDIEVTRPEYTGIVEQHFLSVFKEVKVGVMSSS